LGALKVFKKGLPKDLVPQRVKVNSIEGMDHFFLVSRSLNGVWGRGENCKACFGDKVGPALLDIWR
jgi:hypothetical protein